MNPVSEEILMQKGYKRNNKGIAVVRFFCGLIFIAIIVSETKLSFLRKKAPEGEMTEKACE